MPDPMSSVDALDGTGRTPGGDQPQAEHVRETTTPMGDGTLLADCSCGGTYSVPQGTDEYAALEAAHLEHEGAEGLDKWQGAGKAKQ